MPNGSPPLLLAGVPPPHHHSLKVRLSVAEAEHFSDLSQSSSSPLEEGAENEQATDFPLDTELLTTVSSNK